MAIYVPRVLVCGSVEEFNKKIGDKPAEVVGQINFVKTGNEVQLFFGERSLTGEDICEILDGAAEYLIFTDDIKFYHYREYFPVNWQVMSVAAFAKNFQGGFFSYSVANFLNDLLNYRKNSGCVLDFDCYLVKSDLYTQVLPNIEFRCIADNLYPIMENVYGKTYRSFNECKFHHFDVLLLTKERTPAEFVDTLIKTNDIAEEIWTFVRRYSLLEKFLNDNQNGFNKIEIFNRENGSWYVIKKIMPPVDLGVYVVTHKDAKLDTLPDGYRFIHAGHALAKKDFGYPGDDTGDNISELNPFLDEVTALYWIWKNTTHTHTGFVHYRRFLTSDNQKDFDAGKILSAAEILKILNEYDIIVRYFGMTDRTQREMMIFSTGKPDLVKVCEEIVRKHLARTHPDYLDAFDKEMNSFVLFENGIHITRRNIFNAYCEWLFSFIIDATKEMYTIVIDGQKLSETIHAYSRMASFLAERMFTVWLMKNHLRIKTLPIMFRKDV